MSYEVRLDVGPDSVPHHCIYEKIGNQIILSRRGRVLQRFAECTEGLRDVVPPKDIRDFIFLEQGLIIMKLLKNLSTL